MPYCVVVIAAGRGIAFFYVCVSLQVTPRPGQLDLPEIRQHVVMVQTLIRPISETRSNTVKHVKI